MHYYGTISEILMRFLMIEIILCCFLFITHTAIGVHLLCHTCMYVYDHIIKYFACCVRVCVFCERQRGSCKIYTSHTSTICSDQKMVMLLYRHTTKIPTTKYTHSCGAPNSRLLTNKCTHYSEQVIKYRQCNHSFTASLCQTSE